MKSEILLAIVCSTLLILLLVAVVVIIIIVSGRKQSKARLLYEQELRKTEIEIREQMMAQFAREIHDHIGQMLTGIHFQVLNLKLDHPELSDSFDRLDARIGDVSRELGFLSRTLNHDYIGNIGLFAALQMEYEKISTPEGLKLHFSVTGSKTNLDRNAELMVYRIFQETVQNVLKHASAKNLYIDFDTDQDSFSMTIRDDGKGFDTGEVLGSPKASGLLNILKRARLAGLDCELTSSPGKGCLLKLKKS